MARAKKKLIVVVPMPGIFLLDIAGPPGRFAQKEGAQLHITAGAKKVLIAAPATGNVKTIVMGVNNDQITEVDEILSTASFPPPPALQKQLVTCYPG